MLGLFNKTVIAHKGIAKRCSEQSTLMLDLLLFNVNIWLRAGLSFGIGYSISSEAKIITLFMLISAHHLLTFMS